MTVLTQSYLYLFKETPYAQRNGSFYSLLNQLWDAMSRDERTHVLEATKGRVP